MRVGAGVKPHLRVRPRARVRVGAGVSVRPGDDEPAGEHADGRMSHNYPEKGLELGLGSGLGLGLGLDMLFDTTTIWGSNSVDGVCELESVAPD